MITKQLLTEYLKTVEKTHVILNQLTASLKEMDVLGCQIHTLTRNPEFTPPQDPDRDFNSQSRAARLREALRETLPEEQRHIIPAAHWFKKRRTSLIESEIDAVHAISERRIKNATEK